MAETAQQRGREWEREGASLFGMKPRPDSGAGVYKLDAGGHTLVVSFKHTDDESFRVTQDMVQELRDATSGPGGVGQHVTGLIAVRFAGVELVSVMTLGDQIALFKQQTRLIPPTKDEARRSQASTPAFLRED